MNVFYTGFSHLVNHWILTVSQSGLGLFPLCTHNISHAHYSSDREQLQHQQGCDLCLPRFPRLMRTSDSSHLSSSFLSRTSVCFPLGKSSVSVVVFYQITWKIYS